MMDGEVRFVGDLERLVVSPGDKFVLKAPGHLCEEERKSIIETMRNFLGENATVLVLEAGMELGVISEAKE